MDRDFFRLLKEERDGYGWTHRDCQRVILKIRILWVELVVPVSPRDKVSAPSFSCLVATSGKQNSRDFVRDSVRKLSPWRMLWGLGTQIWVQRTN